jgi:hypothetical protein
MHSCIPTYILYLFIHTHIYIGMCLQCMMYVIDMDLPWHHVSSAFKRFSDHNCNGREYAEANQRLPQDTDFARKTRDCRLAVHPRASGHLFCENR